MTDPPVGATPAKVFKQGDRVRILPSVCDVNPHNADLVGQEHVVRQATWHGGDANPYQDVHIVINGVEICFRPSSLEPVGATTGCKCPYRGTFGHFSSCPTQARPPVGATPEPKPLSSAGTAGVNSEEGRTVNPALDGPTTQPQPQPTDEPADDGVVGFGNRVSPTISRPPRRAPGPDYVGAVAEIRALCRFWRETASHLTAHDPNTATAFVRCAEQVKERLNKAGCP